MDTKFGLVLPTYQSFTGSTRQIVELGVEAERLGVDSLWVGDTLAKAPIDALTLLATLAGVTERVTLGTAAMLAALRDPVLTANAITSLDLLSGGRVTLAVGGGFPGRSEPEFEFVGVPWQARNARLDDIVALWKAIWRGARSFHGEVLHYDTLPEFLAPHQDGGPPIWLAAGFTPPVLRRVGRLYDGWLPYPPDVADYARGLATVRQDRPVTGALFATVYVEDDPELARRALEDFAARNYGVPLDFVRGLQVLITGSREQVAARLREFVAAGATHVPIRIASVDPDVQAAQLPLVIEAVPRSVVPAS
ncbi:LLM class flavin-dependent oxidoreductase [Amycolatopsis sp. cg5]|uniref:LLM class flavin-dependent oxidoreductase n=1 Tax=Amycolatopsis sp. cg5 TaxID=3238802 RepID=UPI00352345BE